MKLTWRRIEGLECPTGKKDAMFFDDEQRGLAIRVTSGRSKTFLAQYTLNGSKKRVPLGSVTAISLETARKAAAAVQGDVAQGRDPAGARKEAARQAREKADAEALTLRFLIGDWENRHLSSRREAYRVEATRALRFAFEKHLDKPALALTAKTVKATLNEISDAGKQATARLTLAYGRAAFGWGILKDLLSSNPFEGIKLDGVPDRERVLSDDELRAIWEATDHPGSFNAIVRALILTGQRREEVAQMAWSEIAPDRSAWTLPAERAKNGKAHIVPLSGQMRAHLEAYEAKRREARAKAKEKARVDADNVTKPNEKLGSDLVFPGRDGPFNGFSKAKAALDEASGVKDWRLHDLRRTLATGLQRLGARLEVTEAVLNHVSGSRAGIVGIYQRHDYAAEKRAALDAWDAHLKSVVESRTATSNVTPLRRGDAA